MGSGVNGASVTFKIVDLSDGVVVTRASSYGLVVTRASSSNFTANVRLSRGNRDRQQVRHLLYMCNATGLHISITGHLCDLAYHW